MHERLTETELELMSVSAELGQLLAVSTTCLQQLAADVSQLGKRINELSVGELREMIQRHYGQPIHEITEIDLPNSYGGSL